MKIGIIVRILWPGGVQRIAIAEAEGLTRLGNDVELIFIRRTTRYTYSSEIPFRVIYDDKVNNRFAGKLLRKITLHYGPQRGSDATVDMDLIRKFEHSIKKQYDIIYYFDEFSAFFSKYSKKKFHHKVAVCIHEVAFRNGSFLSKVVQYKALKNADLILTNSKANLQLLKEAGYGNSFEVYPGLNRHVPISAFQSREDVAISVTMWDFGRKPEALIEIAKNLTFGKILICGDWTDIKYMNNLKRKIIEEKIENKVEITGPLSEEELTNLYKRVKISIRFGYNEKGPGMGSLESIAWGLPLIINSGIGIKEKIIDGINGIIVDESNSKDVAHKIEKLLKDQLTWDKMSSYNIKLAEELEWDKHNAKLNDLMQSLLSTNY
jgi:glycosyltransferase involved in cell wall biosynthesis